MKVLATIALKKVTPLLVIHVITDLQDFRRRDSVAIALID
jgi:hypothetical protein